MSLDHAQGRRHGGVVGGPILFFKIAARQPPAEPLGADRPCLAVAIDIEIGITITIGCVEEFSLGRQSYKFIGLRSPLLALFLDGAGAVASSLARVALGRPRLLSSIGLGLLPLFFRIPFRAIDHFAALSFMRSRRS